MRLYLQDNQITGVAPGMFHGLNSLQGLYLNNNKITALAAGRFDGLNSLTTLNLQGNPVIDQKTCAEPLHWGDRVTVLGQSFLACAPCTRPTTGIADGETFACFKLRPDNTDVGAQFSPRACARGYFLSLIHI